MGQLGLCQLRLGLLQWIGSVSALVDSVSTGFHAVHDVAAGFSAVGVTGTVHLTAGVAGKGVNIVSATSLVIGASGLIASGLYAQISFWKH